MPLVTMLDPATGDAVGVPEADVALRVRDGWTVEGAEQTVDRLSADQLQDEFGGVASQVAAGAAGVARGLTFGLSDAALSALGEGDTLRKLRQANPLTSTITEIGGSVGGALTGVGAAGAAAKLGTKIGAKGTIGAVAKGGAVESGLAGLGTGISEVSLAEDMNVERAVSVLSSNLLYGAAIGGGANLAGKVLEKGIVRAKGALDEFAAARNAAPDVGDDLAGLDVKQLAERELGEKTRLVGDQQALRQTLPDRVSTYQREFQEANPWLVINEGEGAKLLTKSKGTLRSQLDTPAGIAEAPRPTLQALRAQETALQRTLADVEGITAKLAAADAKVAKEVGEKIAALTDDAAGAKLSGSAAKRYRAWADVKGTGVVEIPRDKAAEFIDAIATGKVAGDTKAAFERLPGMLERNQALQADILRATSPKGELASPLLDQIKIAKDAAAAGRGPKSLGEQMAGGAAYNTTAGLVSAIPVIGPFLAPFVGAKAAGMIGSQVFGRLGKATTEAAARTSKAVGAFLDTTKRITPVAPVLATKVLGAVRYAPEREKRSEPAQGKTLATSFKARSEEIRSQTAFAPDGSTVMRPLARQAMAAQLAPIRAASPIMADRMETLAARRLEFLASKLPRRADLGTLQTGPDRYQPSDLEMRAFARYAAGVEDPGGIEERLAAGQITPEDAEVMREVYPERLAEITRQIVEQLPTLRQTLPYPRRLALSILTGVAVDASMHPRVLAVLQSQYASEEGTEGGTQAPRAQAQFGSVKSTDKATPAQERAS